MDELGTSFYRGHKVLTLRLFFYNKLSMYIINFTIIYDVVKLFSVNKYKSLSKPMVGMNWSTTIFSVSVLIALVLKHMNPG